MQIVIPMSGFGERFRRAGYTVPKPLIPVDGKPIIAHVIDMFPGETDFVFICNEDHLSTPEYQMAQTLRKYAPEGRIIAIPPHKLGPVAAVLQAKEAIDPDEPIVVNYCDFTCYWDYDDFKLFVEETDCDGCVPAYRGFHPHSLGSTFYAYVRHEGLWMTDIQEKKPFTDNPMDEFASSGTYYFKSGRLCIDTFEEQVDRNLDTNGEYYASMAYKVLMDKQQRSAVYDLQHFMQWGTPADLEQYLNWSKVFRRLMADQKPMASQTGTTLIPMAGLGSRFATAGFEKPKPLIPVSGRPMVIQASQSLPQPTQNVFVLRQDLPELDEICRKLRSSFLSTKIKILDGPTEGQAITCLEGMDAIENDKPVTIGACDNAVLFDTPTFEDLMKQDGPDVLVWTVRGHPDGIARPEMFGWIDADQDGCIRGVSVKKPLADPRTDPLITGTFTFRKADDFKRAADSLVSRDHRVNGEFYVDSLIEDAIDLGLDCRIFEVDAYIGWGTPEDLGIFEYWQSCFHKWPGHPYRLDKDPHTPVSQIPDMLAAYKKTVPERPAGTVRASDPKSASQKAWSFLTKTRERRVTTGQIAAIGVDLLTYIAALALGATGLAAKAISSLAAFGFFQLQTDKPDYLVNDRTRDNSAFLPVLLIGALFLNMYGNKFLLSLIGDFEGRYVAASIGAGLMTLGLLNLPRWFGSRRKRETDTASLENV